MSTFLENIAYAASKKFGPVKSALVVASTAIGACAGFIISVTAVPDESEIDSIKEENQNEEN